MASSVPALQKSASKNVAWYTDSLTKLSPAVQSLFISYAHFPPDQIIPHILLIRDKAWDIHPFPCLGQFRFLDLGITESPHYPAVLACLSDPAAQDVKFLDMACCFGQDVRKLVADGAFAERLIGCDLYPGFLELGYELFKDRDKLRSTFFAADVFDRSDAGLVGMVGRLDFIHATSFFHLFSYDREIEIAVRIVKLLRPVRGSMVFGRQMGNENPHFVEHGCKEISRHNEKSFERLWQEAVSMVEGEHWNDWKVEVSLEEPPVWRTTQGGRWGDQEGARRLRYKVWRV